MKIVATPEQVKATLRKSWPKIGVLLAISLLIIVLYLKTEFRDALVFLISNIFGVSIGLLSFRASRSLHQRGTRLSLAWGLVGAGQLLAIVGNVVWIVYNQITQRDNYSSPADILFLITYLLFFIAGLMIPSKKSGRYDAIKTGIDIIIVMLAALLVYWNFLLGPLVQSKAGRPAIDVFLALLYPVADMALFWLILVIVYRISYFPGVSPIWTVLIALLINIGLDTGLSYQTMLLPTPSTSWVMAANIASFFVLGVGAYLADRQAKDPDWVTPEQLLSSASGNTTQPWLHAWVGYLPYVWVACVYLLLVFFDREFLPMTLFQLTVSVGVIILLFIIRQAVIFRENQALYANLQASHKEVRNQAEALSLTNREMQLEITERRRAEERLSYDALHDSLTGLSNRALLLNRIDQANQNNKNQKDQKYALLFLDLDRFKVVNDSLGHRAGDQLLIQVAQILSRTVRVTDTVARLGGDEFIILLDGIASHEDALATADRIQSELSRPIQLDVTTVYASASIGVVTNTEGYTSAEELLRDADLAMYQAKAQGKARYAIFDSDMRALAVARLELENDLRRALECHEFLLYYSRSYR